MNNYLSDNNLSLRAPEPEDLDLLYVWENDTSIWQLSNTLTPFSHYLLKLYIENSHQDIFEAKQLRLMIDIKTNHKSEPITIGCVDLFDFDPYNMRAGVGILIADRSARGKGYATSALKLVIDYVFNKLMLKQLFCNITSDNKNSIKLFEKLGFRYIGTKEQWIKTDEGWLDENLYQLINEADML